MYFERFHNNSVMEPFLYIAKKNGEREYRWNDIK